MKILIVGMNPSNAKDCQPGLKKSGTFKRLEKWCDLANIKHFSFINTFDEYSTPTLQKVNYERLNALREYDKVVALGDFVGRALNRARIEHLQMPHPSGLNRNLNDADYERSVILKLKDYINEH
jgi:hypothetical protein